MELNRQYEQIGKSYIEGRASFFSGQEDWARTFLAEHLAPLQGKTVLDLGCGHGPDILIYEGLGATVHGIDASDYMVAEARKRVPHPDRIQVADIESLPFPDGMFDIVVSRFGFHYLKDFDKGYAEAARVLKPQGLLALILPYPLYDAQAMGRCYNEDFLVQIPLYNGAVTVTYPHHTMQDYLSPLFAQRFSLEDYGEYTQKEAPANLQGLPSALAVAARKR